MARHKQLAFADAIANWVDLKGLKQREVAEAIGMNYSTFRVRLSKNEFRQDEIEAIIGKLGMTLQREDVEFGVACEQVSGLNPAPATLADALRHYDRHRKPLDTALARASDETLRLMSAMHKGDIQVVTTSTVTPIVMESTAPQDRIAAVATGVANGGVFVFIRPTPEYIAEQYEETLHFDKLLGAEQSRREFAWFKERLATWLAANLYLDRPEDAPAVVAAHVIQLETDRSPFWAAGFSIGMVQTPGAGGEVVRRMTVRVPGSRMVHLQPEYEVFSWRFGKWAARVIAEEIRKGEEALVPILAALTAGGRYE